MCRGSVTERDPSQRFEGAGGAWFLRWDGGGLAGGAKGQPADKPDWHEER